MTSIEPAEAAFLGSWRQRTPDPSPASIRITFAAGGRLTYSIETDTIQHLALTWRLEGDMILTRQPGAPDERRSRFWFASPSTLVLERDGDAFTYERA